MDEQAAPDRDAIPPQPRTVGRASVPGPPPAPADAPPPVPRAATTYTAARNAPDDGAVDDGLDNALDRAPRIPLPRVSEPGADFGLPATMRGASEPLPRRRARSIQEFTDGPDPSSGGTPWSPFGGDEKPPPPQDPNPYRVRATARVPGSLPPVDPQRADRILPDGPLIDELFFDGPPVNRLHETTPAVAPPSSPPSAADYAAALMREWKSETADRDAERDSPPDADRSPAAHDPWADPNAFGAQPLAVNSGRARNVTIRSFPDDADNAYDEPPVSLDVEQPGPDQPAASEPFLSVPVSDDPDRGVPDIGEPDLGKSDLSGSDLSESDLGEPDRGGAARPPEESAQDDKRLLGLFGDSFDDLSFDRTPFDHASRSDAAAEQPEQAAPEHAVPDEPIAPDLAALYGTRADGAAAPAYTADAYWGSAEPLAPLPRREPRPIESLPFDAQTFDSGSFDSGSFDSGPFESQPFESQPFESQPSESEAIGAIPTESRSEDVVAESQPGAAAQEEPQVAPVIGTIRAAVRVPGLMVERPPAADDDDDRPLAVPQALAVPPVLDRSEPAPDGAIVTYSADDWRGNVRGSAAVSSESGGTVYVSDVDDDDEDEPLSLTQKLLRSGVIVLLIVLFVAAFRYGPNIDEWLHS